ncbi:SusC/RagA family TonB-linked outer membrane protein [Kaistella sp. 97-N-M2]|uniref:SusC/RagA family TonB-linked outer membrane protein n=1 Tax=Kaistella sp. 97-N-M2 TaxID=2908645 RepID=UPI001F28FE65|nr:SusC/RagA family TonB-linked outer membrane protein [Kaistella sp. 97-N-M2]UJF28633.1 SusC/RagA family TonB-linked outer membrane protein [Kaistella sp. 97-N-M2]
MKKLTTSVLAVVLTSSFALVNAQVDTARTQNIEGVVVTALGIKREKKSLTYSTQQVSAEDLNKGTTNTGNIASQLSGKVAGLQVNTNNNFGGSSNLVIRGYKSLKGGGPLIVIDGSPVSNSSLSGFLDYGNFLSDINQQDIESINVLKGAAASALYGERGLNGVIVITTKTGKGRNEKEWGVTLSTSANFGVIDKSTFPTYQSSYGGGYAPEFTFGDEYTNYNDDASLGPKYDGHPIFFWDSFDPNSVNYGKKRPYQAASSTPVDFFETASNYTNSISMQKAGDKSNFLLNYTNQLQGGILPNSDLRKNTLSTKFNFDFTDKLSADIYSSLTLQDTKGRNETGYSDNIMSNFRQWWNVDSDINALRSAYMKSGQNISWNRNSPDDASPAYWNNPYYQRYESYNSDKRTRTFSTAGLNYKFNKNITAGAKLSYDAINLLLEQRVAEGSVPQNFGASNQAVTSGYSKQNIKNNEINFDVTATYNYDLTDNLELSGLVGANTRRNRNESDYVSTEGGLTVPGLFAIGNSAAPILAVDENLSTISTSGVYGTATLGFMDTYFIDGSYRVDKSSTLPKETNSYDYGSIAGSVVLSSLIKQDWLSFWKIRGNYAVVGGSAGAYQLKNTYSNLGGYNGTVLFDTANTRANAELKPERSKEVELGMEMQFFKRRLGFDVTVYQSKTTNQIINLPVSVATGFSATVFNAGRIDNKGIEVSLNATPFKSQNFSWDISANWAKNENTVVELENGVDNYLLGSYQGGVQLVAAVGEAFGALYGTDYVYVDGQRVVTAPNAAGLGGGLWAKSDKKVIGNVTPDWTGGVRNTFSYKGISMSFLIDVQKGGDTFSTDLLYGQSGGLYANTADIQYRDPLNVILPGVYADGNPNVTPLGGIRANGTRVRTAGNYYSYQPNGYNNAPNSEFVYDAGYVKLREASISYTLPKSIMTGSTIKDVTVSLVGRNLWIIDKNTPYVDPEAGVGGGLRSRGNSIGILPTTRDFGFNVTVKF